MKKLYFLFLLLSISSFRIQAQDVEGTDFFLAFPDNGASPASYDLTIVSAGFAVTGKVYYRTAAGAVGITVANITIPAAGAQRITIPYTNVSVVTGSVVSKGGVHVSTDTPVSVYTDAYDAASIDGEAILPSDQMTGTSFVGVSYSELQDAQITIISTKPNTNITITPKRNGAAFSAPINVTLTDSLQSYTYTYGDGGATSIKYLTGSKITSDKPIYVYGRSACSWIGNVQYSGCGACDVMMSPLVPEANWGSRFITGQILARGTMSPLVTGSATGSMADYLEISAGAVSATVTINRKGGTNSLTIPAYGRWWYEVPKVSGSGECNTVITSTAPVQVYQYMKGWQCDNTSNADSECILVHPESRWTNEYRFGLPFTPTSPTYQLTVVADASVPGNLTSFKVDAAAITLSWQPLFAGSTYSIARYSNPAFSVSNVHTITSIGNFSVYILTSGTAESFVTQGGAKFLYITAVPIQLTSFDAKAVASKVALSWSTATELDNDHFEIERSIDGINYYSIGSIAGAGNSSLTKQYSFTDNSPIKGINYYRLKQSDLNGKSSYSSIKSILFKTDKIFNFIALQPNPVNEELKLSFVSGSNNLVSYHLVDLMGRKVLQGSFEGVINGNNEFSINTSSIDKGVYYLMMSQEEGENTISKKLIKN